MAKKFFYDFSKLQMEFQFMSRDDIIKEWLKVSDLHRQLMQCELDVVNEYCEPIDNAREFLGFYLANLFCNVLGYKVGY